MLCSVFLVVFFFFFKQKTAYEMRISDWSSDVCSSDLSASAPCFAIAGGMPNSFAIDSMPPACAKISVRFMDHTPAFEADRAAPIAKTIAARGCRTSRSFDCHSQMRSIACDGSTHLSGGAPCFLVGADPMSIFGKIKAHLFPKK